MADSPNGQATWDDQVAEMRDLGLKYMNSALNAAGGQGGGISHNTFNFPQPASTPAAIPPSAGTGVAPVVSGFLSSPVAKGILLGLGGPALLAAGSLLPGLFKSAAPVPATPPAAVAPDDDNIGVKADLFVDPPGTMP